MFLTAGIALVLHSLSLLFLVGGPPRLPPEGAALVCAFIWLLLGPRACLTVLPSVWACLYSGWIVDDRLAPELVGRDVVVRGTVCSVPKTDRRAVRFILRPDRVATGTRLPRDLYISWYEQAVMPMPGDSWRFRVRLRRPRGSANPGAFDFERWAFVRGVGATGYVRASALNRRFDGAGGCWLTALRFHIAQRIGQVLSGGAAAAHVAALAVGVRDGLTDDDWALLRDSGTVHLFAISGLHIGLVAGLALILGHGMGRLLVHARLSCAPYFFARLCALCAATGYAAMAGFAVPTVRALVMFVIVLVLSALRRAWSGLALLGAALYAVLILDPVAPVSVGFWLSFCAVAALLINGLERRAASPKPFAVVRSWLGRLVVAQGVIAVGLGPLTALFFGQVSWVAPVVNFFIIPVFAFAVVPLVLAGTVLLFVGDVLARPVLDLADTLLAGLLAALAAVTSQVMPVWRIPIVYPVGLGFAAICGLALVWPRPLKGRIAALALTLPLTVANPGAHSAPPLQIVVMDVGQGLAVLIRTPGYTLLYDAGPAYSARDAGEAVVIPVLHHLGIKRLDLVILSHPDADHRGGLRSVLAEFPAPVMAPGDFRSGDITVEPAHRCSSPRSWQRDGVVFEILGPPVARNRSGWSENNLSCVLQVTLGQFRVLLPGDIERAAETALVRSGRLQNIDVILAAHHGSRTSSTVDFVRATRPDIVVYSAAHGNRWGFPDPAVVARWQSAGSCQLATAQSGAITIEIPRVGAAARLRMFRVDSARIWTEKATRRLPCPSPD